MSCNVITFVTPAGKLGSRELDVSLLLKMADRVKAAENKHPDFSDGIYQSVGFISEEVGELNQAVNKKQGLQRIMDENWDVIVVSFRTWRGDWRPEKNGKTAVLEKKDIPPTGDPLFPVHGCSWFGTGF